MFVNKLIHIICGGTSSKLFKRYYVHKDRLGSISFEDSGFILEHLQHHFQASII